jgi:hypothetical protein
LTLGRLTLGLVTRWLTRRAALTWLLARLALALPAWIRLFSGLSTLLALSLRGIRRVFARRPVALAIGTVAVIGVILRHCITSNRPGSAGKPARATV